MVIERKKLSSMETHANGLLSTIPPLGVGQQSSTFMVRVESQKRHNVLRAKEAHPTSAMKS